MADIYLKLQKLEYELLGTGIKAYLDEPQERLAMYDKLDDLSLIEDIVEYLRDNDTWVVGTIKKKFDDQSKTMVERNADVDEFITQVFDAISSSKINTTQLALLETQYNSNIGYKEVTADIYSEENYTQLVNSSKEQLDFISENGDSVIKGLGELDPNIPAMAKQINQERLFNEQKFFTNIRQGIWGAEEKLLLVELTKERYPDDYQVYVDFYTGIIDSAYNYSGTPDKKIANMFKNIYPKFVEAPLMVKNDYAEFAYFGEDLLDALVFSIYSSFMKGVNTLSSDSDKYWSYMDNIVVAAVGIGLSGDDSYSYRTFNYMGLTLFTILSAPLTTAEWSSFKVWKEDAANINKTYKDFAYENWKLKNPGKGNASFDEFYAEVWRSWVASDVAKISEEDAKDAYGIWKNRRKNRGF